MEFGELDEAKKSCAGDSGKHVKKKAKMDHPSDSSGNTMNGENGNGNSSTAPSGELRTGRWTPEETAHCDLLIHHFTSGRLPLSDGLKLNEFLANMLRSKQSRLTKKMKNAKLSSKTFRRTLGFLGEDSEARSFSEVEASFFQSISNPMERAQMKFHTSKEWREAFSTYCVSHGQSLNVDAWLASVEEMERRNLKKKEVERVKRREMMMGCALRQDLCNPDRGVVIEGVKSGGDAGSMIGSGGGALNDSSYSTAAGGYGTSVMDGTSSSNVAMTSYQSGQVQSTTTTSSDHMSSSQELARNTTSPFLHKIINFLHRHHVPFEYVDVWVPSFVPEDDATKQSSTTTTDSQQPKCRLCFAGSSITKQVILESTSSHRRAVPLSPEESFNLSSFGDYSESFSFDVGCGLPGRVYHMGVPTWEQSVHNAPLNHFERVGGAQQWGIRTVVGIPVPSPNVGRVVVVLYSRYDRVKDHDLVIRLTEEFTRLMPSPKWKLVVDVGEMQVQSVPSQQQSQQHGNASNASATASNGNDSNILTSEVISMFGEHMPSDPSNPGFAYLQGFMSLRLLLLRPTRTNQEQDIVNTILSSYSSYKAGGRTRPDMALMLARDFMFLNQQHTSAVMQQGQVMQQQQQQQQQQSFMGNANHHNMQVAVQNTMNTTPLMAAQQSHPAPHSSDNSVSNFHHHQQQQSHLSQQQQQSNQGGYNNHNHQMPPPPPPQEQEYYNMMDSIEPAPIHNLQNFPSAGDTQPQPQNTSVAPSPSPLDAAVENVESLLSPEMTESAAAGAASASGSASYTNLS